MTKSEKEILKKLAFLIPKMDKSKKEYLLGVADGMMLMENEREIINKNIIAK